MDFARKQMKKYGWTEGKGLGKNENGISVALKPKLKFDTAGVGHNISEQYTFNWWENIYNKAAENINVGRDQSGNVNIALNNESIEISTKKCTKKKHKHLAYGGSFLKTSVLTANGTTNYERNDTEDQDKEIESSVITLTDDQLFVACGGRTAHKGARHGLTQSGKLSRIEQHEQLLLKQMQKNKRKKSKKRSYSECDDNTINLETAMKHTEAICNKQKRKKIKIQKRRLTKKINNVANQIENDFKLDQ